MSCGEEWPRTPAPRRDRAGDRQTQGPADRAAPRRRERARIGLENSWSSRRRSRVRVRAWAGRAHAAPGLRASPGREAGAEAAGPQSAHPDARPVSARGPGRPGSLGSSQASEDPPGDRPDPPRRWAAASPDDEDGRADTPLLGFLEQLALGGDADRAAGGDRRLVDDLHAAKGLEFDAVWMTGMEERVFPSSRSLGQMGPMASGEEDPAEMAEERPPLLRGDDRARKRLSLSLARCRSLFGELRFNVPSRFVRELPDGLTRVWPSLESAFRRCRSGPARNVFYARLRPASPIPEDAPLPAPTRWRDSRYDPASKP